MYVYIRVDVFVTHV